MGKRVLGLTAIWRTQYCKYMVLSISWLPFRLSLSSRYSLPFPIHDSSMCLNRRPPLLLSSLNNACPHSQGNSRESVVRSHIWRLPQTASAATELPRASNMSSPTMFTTAESPIDPYPGSSTTSGAEDDHVPSSPGKAPNLGDILNPAIERNGDMDWESWPTGRPGPFVSEARMAEVMDKFQYYNGQRTEQSRTTENVVHIAEFSSAGQGEPELSHRAHE